VLDIGANTGQFAEMIHKILPIAAIVSFEPIEECYQRLIRNMASVPTFRAFNYALGETDTNVEMYVNDYTASSSLLQMEELHKQEFPFTAKSCKRMVKIKQLDEVARNLDLADNLLIKIDVQGYEDRVIRGGQETVSRAKVVIIETSFQCLYIGQAMFEDIYDMLKQKGFRYIGALEQLRSPLNGSVLQADSVFIKNLGN
jgi:FkbM family methyltransferase